MNMSLDLFLILAAAAVVVSPLVILIMPRARRSTLFDLLLWGGTLLVAFLGGWYALGMSDLAAPPGGLAYSGIPLIPVILGALIGAFAVSLPLWLADRFEHREEDALDWDEDWEEEDQGPESAGNAETPARDSEPSEKPAQDQTEQ